ncbi:MAG: YfbU family protein, partial [Aurantimicrobium sp.]
MATINIRIDDRVRDHLKELADEEGVTLSEYARGLLMEATVPVREDANPSGGMAPSTMGLYERQTLSLLHRILGNTLPEGSDGPEGDKEHQLMLASVLESGYSDEYAKESAGIRAELSIRDCGRVKDILDMYREIAYSVEHHQENSDGIDDNQVFRLEFK